MSIIPLFVAIAVLVPLFWLLHKYAIRRGRWLAIQELEFQSGKLAEDKQMVDVVHIQQLKDRKGVPLGTQISSTIKSEQKARIKPSIAVNE